MVSIYSLHKQAPAKGLIEIFDIYGGSYFNIFLDGILMETVYKEGYVPTVLTRKFIKQCSKKAKVDEEDLHFVLYNLYFYGSRVLQDYDSNDYQDYQAIVDLVQQHGKFPVSELTYLAKGITKLEGVIA